MIEALEDEVGKVHRHLEILALVIENEPIGIVKLADETGYPKHKVRYSLRVLEDESLVEPTERGAVVTDRVEESIAEYRDRIDELLERLRALSTEPVSQPP